MGAIIRGKIMKIESKDLIKTLQKWQESNTTYTGLKESALLQKVIDEVQRMTANEEIKLRIEGRKSSTRVIAGKLNDSTIIRYWNVPDNMAVNIGDYAIVENINGYDLVQVVGIVETKKEYPQFLAGRSRGVSKRVVSVLMKEIFEQNKGEVNA